PGEPGGWPQERPGRQARERGTVPGEQRAGGRRVAEQRRAHLFGAFVRRSLRGAAVEDGEFGQQAGDRAGVGGRGIGELDQGEVSPLTDGAADDGPAARGGLVTARTSDRTVSSWSACSGRKGSGGRIFRTLPLAPVALIRTRRPRIPLTIAEA